MTVVSSYLGGSPDMNSLQLFCRELQLITVHLTNMSNTVIYQDLISSVLAHTVNTNMAIKVPKQ